MIFMKVISGVIIVVANFKAFFCGNINKRNEKDKQ